MRIGRCLVVALLSTHAFAASPDDLAAGRRTYQLHCIQCHGADGDLLGYEDIVPIAGIRRRYPPDKINRLTGAFSGRVFYGKDRDQLVAYMNSLRGAKDYPDPGWLLTPQMLERKAPRIGEFRVLDARGTQEYAAGHVPNAVSVKPCLDGRTLADLGISPDMLIVVYDDSTGPAAACSWWSLRRAGHNFVAVMDGGWSRWVAEQRAATQAVPHIRSVQYPAPAESQIARPARNVSLDWNWRAATDSTGVLPFRDLQRLAKDFQPGIAYRAPAGDLSHLALVLSLLGYQVHGDAATLWID